jgi:hypothetical protein
MAQLTTNSRYATGQLPVPVGQGADIVSFRATHTLSANPAAGDAAHLFDLPPDHVIVDFILDAPDLDTNGAPTVTISVGTLNAAKTALVDTFLAASTIGQAGGIARPTLNTAVRMAPSSSPVSIGITFPATCATFAAGTVGLTVLMRPAHGLQ